MAAGPEGGSPRAGGHADLARAAGAVAATYVAFLIHAQFGFLHQLRAAFADPTRVQLVMAAMGLAGLAASLGAGPLLARVAPRRMVRIGFTVSAAAAVLAPLCYGLGSYVVVAAATGAGLALLTTALAVELGALAGVDGGGRPRIGLAAGLGTGIAYFLCNVPWVFEAPPAGRAWFAAVACGGGLLAVWRGGTDDDAGERRSMTQPLELPSRTPGRWLGPLGFGVTALVLGGLVFVDSAAFALIQQSPAWKAATWATAEQKLLLGTVHLVAAVLAGVVFDRGGLRPLLWLVAVAFVVALAPLAGGEAPLAPLYAAGISVYSAVLVAYPGARSAAGGREVAQRWRAALLFGLAGWVASAAGVGMAQDLGRLPLGTSWTVVVVLAAGELLVRGRRAGAPALGSTALLAAVGIGAVLLGSRQPLAVASESSPGAGDDVATGVAGGPSADAAAIARGRAVYVAEGCIHCHSQYVRPAASAAADERLWGPSRPLDRHAAPVLIGNRRTGPDLATVGARRSSVWQRLHLETPRRLVPGSRMPSYRHLFAAPSADGTSTRGADLVAYLGSLGVEVAEEHAVLARESVVEPAPDRPSSERGAGLFARYCAVCHGAGGRGDGPLAPGVPGGAKDLTKPTYFLVPTDATADPLAVELARVVRYGVPGTSMPGHEWLTTQDVADLVAFVAELPGSGAADPMVVAAVEAGRRASSTEVRQ